MGILRAGFVFGLFLATLGLVNALVGCRHDYLLYLGGRRPGELAHASMLAVVLARRAFCSSASCSGPGCNRAASSRVRCANAISRSFRDMTCLNRRRFSMARSFA